MKKNMKIEYYYKNEKGKEKKIDIILKDFENINEDDDIIEKLLNPEKYWSYNLQHALIFAPEYMAAVLDFAEIEFFDNVYKNINENNIDGVIYKRLFIRLWQNYYFNGLNYNENIINVKKYFKFLLFKYHNFKNDIYYEHFKNDIENKKKNNHYC